eukprot:3657501-Rhodomonas_salina.1
MRAASLPLPPSLTASIASHGVRLEQDKERKCDAKKHRTGWKRVQRKVGRRTWLRAVEAFLLEAGSTECD